jgi:hypothetical protein
MNNLDPEVGELPEQLIVCGGAGNAARHADAGYAAAIQCAKDKTSKSRCSNKNGNSHSLRTILLCFFCSKLQVNVSCYSFPLRKWEYIQGQRKMLFAYF